MSVEPTTRPARSGANRVKVLCVDDEPALLEGVSLHLRRGYEVQTRTSGADALGWLEGNRSISIILSDMRMPGMDGATFLGRARQLVPDAVRILLTGQADLDSAIAAVNEGQIFRFLTKPCTPTVLLSAVEAAAQQYRLITAERVLLEQTLHGSVKALTDVLALTNPTSFGRATRIKQLVSELATKLSMSERWHVEVAAMLSQLGSITLPAETAEKVYYGQPLSERESKMVARLPAVTEQLLGNIPRLEPVREILASHRKPLWASAGSVREKSAVRVGAQVLRVAADFDTLESQGNATSIVVETLRGRDGQYDPVVLDALSAIRGGAGPRAEIRELPLGALREGMVFADDVRMSAGTLLAARGYEVTASFVERAGNFRPGAVKEPIRVFVGGPGKPLP
jgi:response regulator RpfG family c-di-GMP phosphodiesterase